MEESMFSRVARALVARRSLLLTQCTMEEIEGGGHKVTIGKEFRLETSPAGRKALEMYRGPKYRWASGGGLMVLDCLDRSMGLVRHRDAGAPSFPDHWTVGSGLSGNFDEFVDVDRLITREGVEEFIVATPDGVLLPVSGDEHFSNEIAFGAVASGRKIRVQAGCGGLLAMKRYVEAETHFGRLPGESEITICCEGEEDVTRHSFGLFGLDEGTRGIDVLRVFRVKVPFKSTEIAIYDGEEDRNGKPLNAVVGCLKVEGDKVFPEFVMCLQNGAAITGPVFNSKMAAPLKFVFNAMK